MKLAYILNQQPDRMSHVVEQLEKATRHEGKDAALLGDLIAQAHATYKKLGLDPRDTTSLELYHGLLSQVAVLDQQLMEKCQAVDVSRIENIIHLLFPDMATKKDTFGLRLPIAKKILKESEPIHLMKHLGYQSVSAMLKNEDIWELYGALRFIETDEWNKKFHQQLAGLSKKDFVLRPIHIMTMPDIWLRPARSFMADRKHGCFAVKEMGMVASLVLPMRPGAVLLMAISALHYINETMLYSNFFRRLDAHDFGSALADTIARDQPGALVVGGLQLHWRVIQKHFTNHVHQAGHMSEGFSWLQPEFQLATLLPAARFWLENDALALECQGYVFSANLFDNCLNYYHKLNTEDRSLKFMRLSLETELYSRYLRTPLIREHAVARVQPITE